MAQKINSKVIIIALLVFIIITSIFLYKMFYQSNSNTTYDNLYLAWHQPSFASAVKKSAPAVVSIHTTNADPIYRSLGSGVIIDRDGHILTNQHVIENASEILVKLADGRTSAAKIIGTDLATDLAVLKINLTKLPVINIGTSAKLEVGDFVLAIGNPLGLNSTVTQGIISAIGPVQDLTSAQHSFGELLDRLIQTDAAINFGNSGGALVDIQGKLIGINTAIMPNVIGSQGISFAIPIDTAKNIFKQLISNGSISRSWIGVQLSDLPLETRQHLNYPETAGIYVQDSIRNSPAQKAGIIPGDIITRVNGSKAQDLLATLHLISALSPGKTYDIEVFRHGHNLVYPVKIMEKL